MTNSMGPHQAVVEAFQQLAQFEPESASDMERFLATHHEMYTEIASSYAALADRMQSEMPYGNATADSMRDLGAAAGALSGVAQEAHAAFRQEHSKDLLRIEQPRPNEQQWDVDKQ